MTSTLYAVEARIRGPEWVITCSGNGSLRVYESRGEAARVADAEGHFRMTRVVEFRRTPASDPARAKWRIGCPAIHCPFAAGSHRHGSGECDYRVFGWHEPRPGEARATVYVDPGIGAPAAEAGWVAEGTEAAMRLLVAAHNGVP